MEDSIFVPVDSVKNASNNAPIAFTVTNKSQVAKTVRVLFPNASKDNNYDNEPDIVLENHFTGVESGDSKKVINYEDLLHYLRGKVIKVGATQVITEINAASAMRPFTIHTENTKKNSYSGIRVVMTINPYQNQNGNIINTTEFILNNVDGFSGMIFTILPNAKATYYLYPISATDETTPLNTGASPVLAATETATTPA